MPPRSLLARCVSVFAIITAPAGVAVAPAEGADYWIDRPIGELGDLSQVRFGGNKSFSTETIRTRLATDPDVMSTGHATGYLKDYVATLQRRITDGYLLAGFHEAQVDVDFVEKERRIDVVVREGKRYRFGEIIIRGNDRIATAELRAWLTNPKPDFTSAQKEYTQDPDVALGAEPQWIERSKRGSLFNDVSSWAPAKLQKPAWTGGAVGKFGATQTATLERLVRAAYAQQGFVRPKLNLQTVPRDSTVDLIVDVEQEGPRSLLAGFEIVGLERGDRSELLRLIDVKTGDSFDRALITRIERTLWHSGRFQNYSLSFLPMEQKVTTVESMPTNKNDTSRYPTLAKAGLPASSDSGPKPTKAYEDWVQYGRLRIAVKESRLAPPLGKELTAEQKAMLKFRAWLIARAERGDDFSLRAALPDLFSLEVVVSPTKGFVADFDYRSAQHGEARRSFGLESTEEVAGLYVFDRHRKLEVKPKGLALIGTVSVFQDDDEQQKTRLILGWGGRIVAGDSKEPTLEFSARMTPAAAVALATPDPDDDDVSIRVVDDVLIYHDVVRTRINAITGELIDMTYRSRTLPDLFVVNCFVPEVRIDVKVEPGLLAAKLKTWRERTAPLKNEFDPADPITSAVNFILDEPAWNDLDDGEDAMFADAKPLIALARRARDAKLVAPVFEAVAAYFNSKENDSEFLSDSPDLFARLADASFPRNSWPWTQTREFGLAAMQRSRHTQQALEQAAVEADWGPLAFGCAAVGAKKFEYYYLSEPWSEQGMKRTAAVDFERDCKPLLNRKYLSGRLLEATARFVRSLDDAEADYLLKLFSADSGATTNLIKQLRAEPERPLDEVLPIALRKAWNKDAQVRLAGLMGMLLKNK